MKNGYIQTTVALTIAGGMLTIFGWTWNQFSGVNDHFLNTDKAVSKIDQKTDDIDSRLSRIEDKQDRLLELAAKK